MKNFVDETSKLRDSFEKLAKECEKLKEVLKPFADEAAFWVDFSEEEYLVEKFPDLPDTELQVRHLRDARKALEENSLELAKNPNFGMF